MNFPRAFTWGQNKTSHKQATCSVRLIDQSAEILFAHLSERDRFKPEGGHELKEFIKIITIFLLQPFLHYDTP